jgi:TetR/AcrR family transcriptional repressor of lmrAB and yxaGH operons
MALGGMRLLATKGFDGLSFSTVLEQTGAPLGSIYQHFPGGKDQLIKLALERAGQFLLTSVETPPH